MQASRVIKQLDEVKMVVGKTGSAEVPTDPMPPEATDLIIVLKPHCQIHLVSNALISFSFYLRVDKVLLALQHALNF